MVRRSTLVLLLARLLPAAAASEPSPYLAIGNSAWRVAAADLDNDGRDQIVTIAYDGTVRVADAATGATERWRFSLLSGERLPLANGRTPVVIPAGCLRILEVHASPPSAH